nr:hypothetical protein [Tanacetum cinerariifolium]
MDEPNITKEEYIRLKEEKARRHGKVYNWKTATFGRIWYDDDIHDLRSIEIEFAAIVFSDKLTYEVAVSCETMRMTRSSTKELFTPFKDSKREFRSSRKRFKTLSLDESRSPDFDLFSDQEEYSEEEVAETMAETMEQYMSKTRVDYGSGIAMPKIEDKDSFELKGQFLKELRDNTFSGSNHEDANEHIEKVLEIIRCILGRECEADPRQGDLSAYWVGISSTGDFLGTTPSYTSIKDLILRLCHRLIAYNIVGRSQALEKVTMTYLFYLRGMDVGSVNIPYLLARFTRMVLLILVFLRSLMVLSILLDAMGGALEVADGALNIVEGAQVDPTPVPQPPHAARPARSLPQRASRLEEEVHGM